MCEHHPSCPAADSADACTAHIRADHHEQGWCLLCNGVIVFDDGAALLPDGHVVPVVAAAAA
jgi:hypothetical protein